MEKRKRRKEYTRKAEYDRFFNRSSCLKCGVLVIPADDEKIYEFSGTTQPTLLNTPDGFKYVTGPKPYLHKCESIDPNLITNNRLIKNRTIIRLHGGNERLLCEPYRVTCPRCKAAQFIKCFDSDTTGLDRPHEEHFSAGAKLQGYTITWHKQFGRILLRRGAVLP